MLLIFGLAGTDGGDSEHRAFTNTFAGIAPGSVAGFVGAQLVGGAIGLGL